MDKRNLFKVLWDNFLRSFKVKPQRMLGEFKGEDYLGNQYYELEADPRGGRSRASRWFESTKEDLDHELPPEWIAWLRRRRDHPPTTEEIIRNLATSKMKKSRALENHGDVETSSGRSSSSAHSSYPNYSGAYEQFPGQKYYKDGRET